MIKNTIIILLCWREDCMGMLTKDSEGNILGDTAKNIVENIVENIRANHSYGMSAKLHDDGTFLGRRG